MNKQKFNDLLIKTKSKLKKYFGIKTYALIGKSGTGKSYNAYLTAHSLGIHTIIDDGLLIHKGKIIAGRSAKRANTKIGAVKRAIFFDDTHAEEVRLYLKKLKIKKCLLLGTSPKMINIITKKLDLSQPLKFINIEDITTPDDIKKAQFHRIKEGKHVLPVPEVEILKRYADLYVHNIHFNIDGSSSVIEKSVLRPTYSLMGELKISKKVYKFYLFKILEVNFTRIRIIMFNIKEINEGLIISIELGVVYGENLFNISERIQKRLKSDFEYFTGRELLEINLKVTEVFEDV